MPNQQNDNRNQHPNQTDNQRTDRNLDKDQVNKQPGQTNTTDAADSEETLVPETTTEMGGKSDKNSASTATQPPSNSGGNTGANKDASGKGTESDRSGGQNSNK